MRRPAGRLWKAFALGWVLVFAVTATMLARDEVARARLVPLLAVLAALASLYIWVTLAVALDAEDFTLGGPGPALLRRRVSLLAAMAMLVVLLVALAPHAGMWWLAMHVIVATGLALPPRLAAGVMSVVLVAAIAGAWIITGAPDLLLLTQVPFGASAIAVRQLTVSVAQLRAARQQLARAAVDQERLRFARDLHDILGHRLSLISIKSELARRVVHTAPDRAAAEIADVEQAARVALREVRAAVVGYRQPSLRDELDAARELLGAVAIAAEIEDTTGPLAQPLDALLAWAVREGVTNIIRHSRAQWCAIRITGDDGRVRLEVTDDGQGVASQPSSSGSGLAGLRERAQSCGGTLESGARPGGGWSLSLSAPMGLEEVE